MATFFEHVPAAHKSHFANGPLLPPPIRFEYDDEAMEIEPEPIFVLRDLTLTPFLDHADVEISQSG